MALRRLSLALLFFASALGVSAQELTPAGLTRLKEATAYVKWEKRGRLCMGSAYLFRKTATTGYLLTCAHVVEGTERASVVFNSGLPNERTLEATVVASDEARDIACLRVTDGTLPATLELTAKTELRETESVFVAGFPFGEMLATSAKNPNISVSKVSVSSIRRGDRNEVVVVQLDGNVNPGNSGGPVMDARGRVVGMAASKLSGTQTAFAVPAEELAAFLKGRIAALNVRVASTDADSVKLEIEVRVVDPIGSLRSVGWSCIRADKVENLPVPDAAGKYPKAAPGMKDVTLKLADGKATGSIEILKAAGDRAGIEILFQCSTTTAEGTTLWTEASTQWIALDGPASPPVKPGVKPGDTPPVKPDPKPGPPVTGEELLPADTLTEACRYRLTGAVGDMFLSKDGAFLYVLDLSDARVLKLEAETLRVAAALDVPEGVTCMALNARGDTLYVAARITAMSAMDKPGTGSVTAIATATLKAQAPVEIPGDPVDLEVTNSGIAFVSVNTQLKGLLIVDLAKKSTESLSRLVGGSRLRLHSDQSRLYYGTGSVSPGDYGCVATARDPGLKDGYANFDSRYHGDFPMGGELILSPDGGILLGSQGTVLRLSKSGGREADLLQFAKTDPWVCATVATGCASAILGTQDGLLKFVSLRDFELTKSVDSRGLCTHLALDHRSNRLYAHLVAKAARGSLEDSRFRKVYRVGDIVAWSLK